MVFVGNILLSLFVLDLICLANHFLRFSPDNLAQFRRNWVLGTLGIIAVMYVIGVVNAQSVKLVNLEIESSLPRQNRDLNIVLVSDTHLGYVVTKKTFQEWVKMINVQNPDIVVFAGDIADQWLEPVVQQNLHEEFNQLVARYGVFAVRGNHEFMSSPKDGLEQYLTKRTQVQYLRDSGVLIDDSFYVVGRDDRSNRSRVPLSELVKDFDRTKPVILIDHQPTNLPDSQENGITLSLYGHTHAGQFFPGTVGVKYAFDVSHGYAKRGNSHFYVSSGLGTWGPRCRLGSRSEMVRIAFHY
jgi:predicted MPP superfamily phosphohydrolase